MNVANFSFKPLAFGKLKKLTIIFVLRSSLGRMVKLATILENWA